MILAILWNYYQSMKVLKLCLIFIFVAWNFPIYLYKLEESEQFLMGPKSHANRGKASHVTRESRFNSPGIDGKFRGIERLADFAETLDWETFELRSFIGELN